MSNLSAKAKFRALTFSTLPTTWKIASTADIPTGEQV